MWEPSLPILFLDGPFILPSSSDGLQTGGTFLGGIQG